MGGVCLVVGCHPDWKEELMTARQMYPEHDICAVNYAVHLVKADWLVTSHPEDTDMYLNGVDYSPKIVTRENIDINVSGSSGNVAAMLMAALGYDKVIMCGAPINGDGGYSDELDFVDRPYGNTWLNNKPSVVGVWQKRIKDAGERYPHLKEKIRSMSGFTKEYYGGIDNVH